MVYRTLSGGVKQVLPLHNPSYLNEAASLELGRCPDALTDALPRVCKQA